MSNRTKVTVQGFAGTTPTLTISDRGTRFTRFRLGNTPRIRDAITGEWRDGQTDWFTVKVWNDSAENVASSVVKGNPVIVHGTLVMEPWTRDGQERVDATINADAVGIDLNKGTAHFARVQRGVRLDDADEPRSSVPGLPGSSDADIAPLDGAAWETPPDEEPGDADYGAEPDDAELTGAATS